MLANYMLRFFKFFDLSILNRFQMFSLYRINIPNFICQYAICCYRTDFIKNCPALLFAAAASIPPVLRLSIFNIE